MYPIVEAADSLARGHSTVFAFSKTKPVLHPARMYCIKRTRHLQGKLKQKHKQGSRAHMYCYLSMIRTLAHLLSKRDLPYKPTYQDCWMLGDLTDVG